MSLRVPVAWVLACLLIVVLVAPLAAAQGSGEVLGPAEPEVVAKLVGFSQGPVLCYRDADGDRSYDVGESVFVVPSTLCGTLSPGALRLSAGEAAAGIKVGGSGADAGAAVTADGWKKEFRYFDADGNGKPSMGDAFYLAMCGGDACIVGTQVAAGWLRLSSGSAGAAGSTVGATAGDAGRVTSTGGLSGRAETDLRYWDLDGNSAFDGDDIVYWTTTGVSPSPRVNHLRLGPLRAGQGFGDVLGPASPDVVASTVGFTQGPVVCYHDADASGAYNAGDPVYLLGAANCRAVGANDLRLTGQEGLGAGMKVGGGDADLGRATTAQTASFALRYRDVDGNGHPTLGDGFYVAACGGHTCQVGETVAAGWVRVAPIGGAEAGSAVGPGAGDLGAQAGTSGLSTNIQGDIRYWDMDGNGAFDGPDLVYWATTGGAGTPRVNHLRLGALEDTGGFGSLLRPGDPEVVPTLEVLGRDPVLCYRDGNGDGAYTPGEAVYLVPGVPCGPLAANALRLTGSNAGPAGTKVGGSEAGTAVDEDGAAFAFRFHDGNGDGRPGLGDTFYLGVCGGVGCQVAGTVVEGWIRLTSFGALPGGGHVTAADPDLGRAAGTSGLQARLDTDFRFWDLDGNGAFDGDDPVYWATRGFTATPEVNQVRIAPPDQEQPDNGDPTDTDAPDGDATLTPGNGGGPEEEESPGPSLISILAGLCGVAWWGTRRRPPRR